MKTNFTIKVFINGKKYELKLKKHITLQHVIKLLYGKNKSIVLDYNKKIIQKICGIIFIFNQMTKLKYLQLLEVVKSG